jgi:hypothetical protein
LNDIKLILDNDHDIFYVLFVNARHTAGHISTTAITHGNNFFGFLNFKKSNDEFAQKHEFKKKAMMNFQCPKAYHLF